MWWYILFFFPAVILLWLAYEWLEHTWVQYGTTKIINQTLPKNKQLKMCLISDLHNNKKNLSKLLKQIRQFSPEIILLAGDLIDKHKLENRRAEDFLFALSKLNCPVFYSVGNHEGSMMEKHPDAWNAYMHRIGDTVQFLDNQSICIKTKSLHLAISGLSLPKIYYKKGCLYESSAELPDFSIPEHDFHILLAHNPEYVKMYQKYHADLIVSGHLHGGLLRLPFIGGIVSPRLRLPGKDAGLVPLENGSHMFISRGLGSHTIPLRFFNRAEVNFLILEGSSVKKANDTDR